ncbi:hypothetical protein [Bradyrhizobium sp. SZCCHNPS2010]|uniref:hypothetical protein n=1 Tax=Bradyrhizobium sp. SZCCHNPS2010 TaxID=3057333 RepID=UPI0029166C28|nr:hypothetical protein [Bradyrhizobium sp. SZCCHNPS2010]
MNDLIGLHEQYALVPPQTFVDRLTHEWTTRYHNVPSASLRKLWATMALTYREAIIATATGATPKWRILKPPTGSGKTLGAKVYAALQAEQNATTAGHCEPVGIIIVTRLIAQADEVVTAINALSGRQAAVADHTQHRATQEQLDHSDVLVITHQAYVNATQTLTNTRVGKWQRVTSWKGGKRLLTIIDEALCNAIEENQVTADGLSQAIGFIPHELRATYASEVAALESLHEALGHHQGLSEGFGDGACMAWGQGGSPMGSVELSALRIAMRNLPYDRLIGKADDNDRQRIATRIDKALADAEAMLDRWAYFTLKGKLPTLNSAAMLVPMDAPGPVVLDATAGEDFTYELMEDRAFIVMTPPGVRDYSSVTLHVARASGIGKGSMVERAKTRFPRIIEDLSERLSPERSVFFCVHKAVEHELPEAEDLPFAKVAKAHWNAVDGSNDYADCDVAVIFGLPYRDRTTFPTNVFFALQGVQGDDWMDNPTWKGRVNLREHMVRRQLSASVIQAINRIRCRHVTDDHGGCPPADVFIVLPEGGQGDDILAAIRREMPGLQVIDWPFEPDGPKVRRGSAGTPHERLLTFMGNREPGRTSMTAVARELGLQPNARKELQKNLRNENHRTTLALRELGVTYVATKGRGGKSELVKAA